MRYLLTDAQGPYKYSRDEVFKGGLKVVTTLDVDTQEAAEVAAANKAAEPTATWRVTRSKWPWWPSIPTTGT